MDNPQSVASENREQVFLHYFTPKGVEVTEGIIPQYFNSFTEVTEVTEVMKRNELLDDYRKKQPLRVAIGKSAWIPYEAGQFKPEYNLRERLKDEIIIEFDTTDLEIVVPAISQTGFNLLKAGITFEYWEHGGKSPHLHIHNLPIAHLTDNQRAIFKKMFIKKYVPVEYHHVVDLSLTGIGLIALEWAFHWKGCYKVKRLVHTFTPEEYLEVSND